MEAYLARAEMAGASRGGRGAGQPGAQSRLAGASSPAGAAGKGLRLSPTTPASSEGARRPAGVSSSRTPLQSSRGDVSEKCVDEQILKPKDSDGGSTPAERPRDFPKTAPQVPPQPPRVRDSDPGGAKRNRSGGENLVGSPRENLMGEDRAVYPLNHEESLGRSGSSEGLGQSSASPQRMNRVVPPPPNKKTRVGSEPFDDIHPPPPQEHDYSLPWGDSELPSSKWEKLLLALPDKKEIDSILDHKLEVQSLKFEEALIRETQGMKEALAALTSKISEMEEEMSKAHHRIKAHDVSLSQQKKMQLDLALQILDLEGRDRRSNLRFRGIPENIPQDNIKDLLWSICNYFLDKPPHYPIVLDRFHRVPTYRSKTSNKPRDIICKFHYSMDREAITKNSWSKGPYLLEDNEISVLQDIPRKTLTMRRLLKPLLEVLKSKGIPYRWGFPMSLNVRSAGRSFLLKSRDQIPTLCEFLNIEAIEVPDWLNILLEPSFNL